MSEAAFLNEAIVINGIEYATMDYNKKVYNAWYVDFKTNIGIALGIISAILSSVSIFITLL